MANRCPRCLPPPAAPGLAHGLSAGSVRTRRERGKSRGGVRGETPPRDGEAGAASCARRAPARAPRRSSGSLVRAWPATAHDGSEDSPRVPSDEEALCTEALRQRQGAGKGGGALGRAARGGEGRRAEPRRARARRRARRRRAPADPPHLSRGGFPESQWRATQAARPHPSPRCPQPIGRRSAEPQLGRATPLTCLSVCGWGGQRKGRRGAAEPGAGDSATSAAATSGFGRRCSGEGAAEVRAWLATPCCLESSEAGSLLSGGAGPGCRPSILSFQLHKN